MTSLVEVILDVSRIELGKLSIEPRTIDIMESIKAVVDAMMPIARTKHILIRQSFVPEKLLVSIDSTLLHIVIQNLLSNAIKYSRDGGKIDVVVALEPSQILLTVTDNGSGIPKELEHHLFTKLYRTPNARMSGEPGTDSASILSNQL